MSEAKLSPGARRFLVVAISIIVLVCISVIALGYYFYYLPLIQGQSTAPPPEVTHGGTAALPVTITPVTTADQVSPEQTEAAADPVQPEPETEPGVYEGLPIVTVGLDAFAPYYPVLVAKQLELDAKYGINLQTVTFCSDDANCFGESERTEYMQSGEWDVLFTTIDKLALRPDIGKLTTFVDETDGADKLVCSDQVQSLNDLEGKRISYLSESIGEYLVYYLLGAAEIGPEQVALVPSDSVAGAVQLYNDGQVDCVSGWEPDVDEAVGRGANPLITTRILRVALDVIISSNQAVENRPVELQAFHNAYFEALKYLLEDPEGAEEAMIAWGEERDMVDWSYVYAPGDWLGWLETTPQATLPNNIAVMRNRKAIRERLADACRTWAHAGFETPDCNPDTFDGMIESGFVESVSTLPDAITTSVPVNASFLFTSTPVVGEITEEQVSAGTVVVTLPFEKIPFLPNSTELTSDAFLLLSNEVLPIMKLSPNLVLRLTGSAALPPNRSGVDYTEEGSQQFAEKRANTVKDFLSDPRNFGVDADGIDVKRLIVDTSKPQFPRSANPDELEQDRFVRFELIDIGY